MGKLYGLAICGICLSVWAIIQLLIMAWAASINAIALLEDAEPHVYTDYDDFVQKCEKNYESLARNCLFTVLCYVGLLVICVLCLLSARSSEKKRALRMDDDELACAPKPQVKKFNCFKKKNSD